MVNMKFITKYLYTFAIILCLSFVAFAQTNWTGEYFFGEDGGETAGGTKIYIAHTVKITEKDGKPDAHIYSQGYQTSRDIYADVKTAGDKIMFYFREKGEDHVLGDFEKGDLLLTLEKKKIGGKEKILTFWNAFIPVLESNEKSGEVYFEKVKEKSKP